MENTFICYNGKVCIGIIIFYKSALATRLLRRSSCHRLRRSKSATGLHYVFVYGRIYVIDNYCILPL